MAAESGARVTDDELEAIEARANAATPGPWMKQIDAIVGHTCELIFDSGRFSHRIEPHNHDFIAHARTDIPALIAEVRRLQTCDRGRFVCDAEIARLETDLRAAIVGVGLVDNEVNIRRVKHLEAQDLSNGLSVSGDANDGGEHCPQSAGGRVSKMDSNYNRSVTIKLVPGNTAPKYLDEGRQELFIDEVVITEQGMESGLPLVDFKLKGSDGKTYLFVLTGRIVNAISAAVRGANFRNHGVAEP